MTLLEVEQRRSRRKHKKQVKRKSQPKQSALAVPSESLHPNQVLTIREWAALNNIGLRTAMRLLASGNGPVVTQLTEKRIGITVANNAKWQASRARS